MRGGAKHKPEGCIEPAAHQGALQLALRHPADKEVVVTQSADATALKGRKKAAVRPRKRRIEVIEGVEREIMYF